MARMASRGPTRGGTLPRDSPIWSPPPPRTVRTWNTFWTQHHAPGNYIEVPGNTMHTDGADPKNIDNLVFVKYSLRLPISCRMEFVILFWEFRGIYQKHGSKHVCSMRVLFSIWQLIGIPRDLWRSSRTFNSIPYIECLRRKICKNNKSLRFI